MSSADIRSSYLHGALPRARLWDDPGVIAFIDIILPWHADVLGLTIAVLTIRSGAHWKAVILNDLYWSAYRFAAARSLLNSSAVRRGPYPGVSR